MLKVRFNKEMELPVITEMMVAVVSRNGSQGKSDSDLANHLHVKVVLIFNGTLESFQRYLEILLSDKK